MLDLLFVFSHISGMTWVEGIRNTVIKELIDRCCVRTEGTGECLNQRQSKWWEAVESCIICTACKVLGKSKQEFQDGWALSLPLETRENTYKIESENMKETGLSEVLYD